MKPTKVTYEFGEREIKNPGYHDKSDEEKNCTNNHCEFYSEQFEQNCCFDQEYCALRKTKTITITVTFDLWETCPECGGDGFNVAGGLDVEYDEEGNAYPVDGRYQECCPTCHGKGEIAKYYTPEEAAQMIKEQTGVDWEWPKNTDVYRKDVVWYHAHYGYGTGADFASRSVLKFPGQPAPPQDYRPE